MPFPLTEKRSEEENSFHRGVGRRPENNDNENMISHALCCNNCWLGIISVISLTWLHVNHKVPHVVYRGMRNMWRGPTKKIHDVDNLILYYKRTLQKARRQKKSKQLITTKLLTQSDQVLTSLFIKRMLKSYYLICTSLGILTQLPTSWLPEKKELFFKNCVQTWIPLLQFALRKKQL